MPPPAGRAAGDERGHAPQRGLLIGKLTQPCLVGWIMIRPRADGMAHIGAGVWRIHNADGSPMPGGPVARGPAGRQCWGPWPAASG